MFRYAMLNKEATEILEYREYPELLNPDEIADCADGGKQLRIVEREAITVEPWQRIADYMPTIQVERVLEVAVVEDLSLEALQQAAVDAVDVQTEIVATQGFQYDGLWFPLAGDAAQSRIASLARLEWPAGGVNVLTVDQVSYHLEMAEDRDAWVAAADARSTDIFAAHDDHVVTILATTDVKVLATYDATRGFPALPPAGPEIPE